MRSLVDTIESHVKVHACVQLRGVEYDVYKLGTRTQPIGLMRHFQSTSCDDVVLASSVNVTAWVVSLPVFPCKHQVAALKRCFV